MKILLLSEPRSGSTNFANWFNYYNNFTVLYNTIDPKSNWYQNKLSPNKFKFYTEHLLIKEDYYHYNSYEDFINISDKVIILYRKDVENQIKSWINAKKTNNWVGQWIWEEKNYSNYDENFFLELKNSFKDKFLLNRKFFVISYEDLYYGDGINRVIDYLNISELNSTNWPVGIKYRVNVSKTKKII